MSSKTLYITIGILGVISIALLVGGFVVVKNGTLPGIDMPALDTVLPFGNGGSPSAIQTQIPTTPSQTTDTQREPSVSRSSLQQISSRPVAGLTMFTKENGMFIRYMEKQTGHIFEQALDQLRAERVTNTTIPGVKNVLWNENGDAVVFQYLDGNIVKTSGAKITKGESGAGTLEQTFFPNDIRSITVSPDKKSLFYILGIGESAIGTTARFDGSGKKQIFDSPISEWSSLWTDTNTISLLTKPSAEAPGYTYTLSSVSGDIKKILGNITGLTALISKDRKNVFYTQSTNNSFESLLYDVTTTVSSPFPVTTLSEKCVWSKDNITLYCAAPQTISEGAYPDDWYKGLVEFGDAFWKINTETGGVSILSIPEEDARESIDGINLMLNETETTLLFINKKDSTPWKLIVS